MVGAHRAAFSVWSSGHLLDPAPVREMFERLLRAEPGRVVRPEGWL
ncbi:MAG: hypothetical protein R6X16_15050 [Anaerolineae bacterium]